MQLLKHFHELSLHPNNAKELKGLILQLAVQGKLTAQWRLENPDVEPAKKLLERIREEKTILIKEGKINKEKSLPAIKEDEIPYELPEGWVWCRLIETCLYIQRGKSPNYTDISSIPIVSQKCVQWSGFDLSKARFITEESFEKYGIERILQTGDLLWNSTGDGTVGRVVLFPQTDFQNVVADSHVTVVRAFKNYLIPEYLRIFAASPLIQNLISGRVSGSTKQTELATATLKALEFSFPPLEEQKAIVEVVEQLFAEVEQLEQLTVERIQLKEQFATSALRDLTTNNTAKEWGILQANFHTFFNEEPNIKKLGEAILQLAVQGKLTANWRKSNPDVEPADKLLQRIREEKARLIKAGQIKKENPLPAIKEDEIPYELPEGWVWCRLGDLTRLITDGKHGNCQDEVNSGYYFLSAKDVQNGTLHYNNARQINYKEFQEVHNRTNLEPGDLCIVNTGATVGKTAIVEDNSFTRNTTFQKSVAVVKTFAEFFMISYLDVFIKVETPKLLKKSGGSAINNLLLGDMRRIIIPLPTFEEQKTIVESVYHLMALCDGLEQEVKQSKEQVEKWMKAAVREVLGG